MIILLCSNAKMGDRRKVQSLRLQKKMISIGAVRALGRFMDHEEDN